MAPSLKRIATSQLRTGMYLHEMCGSWMEHPFWRTSFRLDDPKDIERILASGVKQAWIDTARGLDVACGETEQQARERVEHELVEAVAEPAAAEPAEPAVQRVSLAEELQRATQICRDSRRAVMGMFREARMGAAILPDSVAPLVQEIASSVMRNPAALISVARLKTSDDYTYMHSVAVCALMIALARQMGLDAALVREAGMAGLLHDVGKMMVPNAVLNKPGRLTDDEFTLVKTHPERGHEILIRGGQVSQHALDVCLHHHEKVDGSGYPHGLAGREISLLARMGAVCDVYDAITSNRAYKRGWDPAASVRKMAEWSKGHFDPVVFQHFVRSVGIYPVGALVRLKSDRLAVVVEAPGGSLLKPVVLVFHSATGRRPIRRERLDLSAPGCTDAIASHEDPANWKLGNIDALWQSPETAAA
jgi:putative nucleotidyltransferase with HDIG domain